MATATGIGYVAPGTTPIVPQYRVIGDYWSFGVQFINPATLLPVPLTPDLVPGGDFFQAYNSAPALDLTVAGGFVTVTDAPNGKVAYYVPAAITQAAVAQSVAPIVGTQTYPTRLQCFLNDSLGRQTYTIVGIVPVDPRTTDLSTIPPATTIVAYAGPAGAVGPGPTQAQLMAAIGAELGQPGGIAPQDALVAEIARAKAAEVAANQSAFLDALIFG